MIILALLIYIISITSAFQRVNSFKVGCRRHTRQLSVASSAHKNLLESRSSRLNAIEIDGLNAQLSKKEGRSLKKTLKVGSLFGLWYALNIGYNITNKRALNISPSLPWTVAFLQLFIGLFYVMPTWLLKLRAKPELTTDEVKKLIPVSLLHTLTHVGGVVSMGAGAVSFSHIVKASEPAVSAALSAAFLKNFLPIPVYLTLLPVMGGVALASLGELSFSWKALNFAMLSSVASASRGIVSKQTMGSGIGKNMDAKNLYAVLTILAIIALFPCAVLLEGRLITPTIAAIFQGGMGGDWVTQTMMSGFFYYLYNEVAFLCLDAVEPITHSLGNTIKRVVIILTSVIVFGTKMTKQGIIGSSMTILGALLYSRAKHRF